MYFEFDYVVTTCTLHPVYDGYTQFMNHDGLILVGVLANAFLDEPGGRWYVDTYVVIKTSSKSAAVINGSFHLFQAADWYSKLYCS